MRKPQARLLKKLVYLSLGLSVILAFIGLKLVLHALHEYHWADWAPWGGEIPIWFSLLIIVGTLAVTTVASLMKSRKDGTEPTEALPDEDPAERPAGIAERGTPPAAP